MGGLLAAAFGERAPFAIAAVAAFITLLLTALTLDETVSPEQRTANRQAGRRALAPRQILGNPALVMVLVVAFGGQFAFGMIQATFALFGEAVLFAGESEQAANLGIGLLLGTVGFGQFMTQVAILPRLLRHLDDARLVLAGSLLRALGLGLLALITSPYPAAASVLVFAVGTGLMMPPLQSISTRTVPDAMRGGVLGVYQSAISLAIIGSTAISGSLFALEPHLPYGVGMVLFLLMALPILALRRRVQPRLPEAAPEA
ncbi:MAG: MFS transporter [Anaerolineae bacterium]|nr:MFS transporter [Anaerolineae bacterium]